MTTHDTIPHFDRGSSVLVDEVSNHSDVQDPVFELLSHDVVNSIVAVTYTQSADAFLRRWHDRIGTIPTFARVIAVGGSMRSTAARTSTQNVVRPVERPDDIAALQTEITSALDDAPEGAVFVFDSLTPLLERVKLTDFLPFFETISNHLALTEATGYFFIDASSHDEATIAALRSQTGVLIEHDEMGWLVRSSTDWISGAQSLDALFDTLRSRQRREVLRYLLFTTASASLGELATVVAKRETGEETLTDAIRRTYSVRLSQIHLPKLEDEGYISYDSETFSVTSRPAIQRAKPFLAVTNEGE